MALNPNLTVQKTIQTSRTSDKKKSGIRGITTGQVICITTNPISRNKSRGRKVNRAIRKGKT